MLFLYFLWHLFFAASILPNLLLLYLIIRKANLMVGRPYNLLLFDMTLSDIFISIMGWFSMSCSLPATTTKPFVYFGLCQHFGPEICYLSSRISQLLVYNNICVIMVSFIARRHVLLNSNLTYPQAILAAVLASIPALISFIIYEGIPKTMGEIDGSDPLLENVDLPEDRVYVYVLLEIGSWQSTTTAVIAPLIQLLATVLSLGFRLNLSKVLRKVTPHEMSQSTKAMHSSLIKTLTLQACAPIIAVLSGSFYILGHLHLFSSDFLQSPIVNSLSTLVNLLIPLLNSLTALFYIPLYRNSLARVWRKQRSSRSSHTTF